MSVQSLSHLLTPTAEAFIVITVKNQVFSSSVGQFVVVLQVVAQLNLQASGDQLLSLQGLTCPHLVLS